MAWVRIVGFFLIWTFTFIYRINLQITFWTAKIFLFDLVWRLCRQLPLPDRISQWVLQPSASIAHNTQCFNNFLLNRRVLSYFSSYFTIFALHVNVSRTNIIRYLKIYFNYNIGEDNKALWTEPEAWIYRFWLIQGSFSIHVYLFFPKLHRVSVLKLEWWSSLWLDAGGASWRQRFASGTWQEM